MSDLHWIIDDESGEILKKCKSEQEAEHWLTYYLNHSHDAYLTNEANESND